MGDFIYRHFGWFITAVIVGIVALTLAAAHSITEENDRLVAQCVADGKKEYECVAMLGANKPAYAQPYPVVMPVYTGK